MKVCLKAAAVTQQDSYFTVQTDSVPIRIWFLTDQILRIRAGFDGDFAEESYSLVTTAWEDRMDGFMKDYRKRITPAQSSLTDGEDKAVIQGKELKVVVEKDPFRICVYDKDGTQIHSQRLKSVQIKYPNPKKDYQVVVSFEQFDLIGM